MQIKWKSFQTGRTITVIGDEIQNDVKYRFFTWDDDSKQVICQWDLENAFPWENSFEQL